MIYSWHLKFAKTTNFLRTLTCAKNVTFL